MSGNLYGNNEVSMKSKMTQKHKNIFVSFNNRHGVRVGKYVNKKSMEGNDVEFT